MKFTIDKKILLDNLNNVIKGISTKNVIPILNGIKFELTNKGLELTASDSELTIYSIIEEKEIKKIESCGTAIIQSKFLLDIIRKLPGDEINFEMIDSLKINIYTENASFNLNCLDDTDYPNLKMEEHKDPIILEGETLKLLINQTVFAISTQELRPLLTGVNVLINGNILQFIATDSYRLAKKQIKLNDAIKEDINIVIPGDNIIELEKILIDNEPVEMHIFNNKVLFKYKNLKFQTNLLSGQYPNISNLIPDKFEMIVKVVKNDYIASVDRASLLTQGKEKNIIKMKIQNQEMIINSYASEIGKVEEFLKVSTDSSANIDISFSSKYMLDALKTIKEDEILLLMTDDVKPIIIKSVEDENLIQLILPIKTY